jgi:predicted small lipoprotein YifL
VGLFDRSAVARATRAGILIALLALAGCGRNGPLEPPPSAVATNKADNASATNQAAPASTPATRTFVLDPLVR